MDLLIREVFICLKTSFMYLGTYNLQNHKAEEGGKHQICTSAVSIWPVVDRANVKFSGSLLYSA
jgi:hypothetical protein